MSKRGQDNDEEEGGVAGGAMSTPVLGRAKSKHNARAFLVFWNRCIAVDRLELLGQRLLEYRFCCEEGVKVIFVVWDWASIVPGAAVSTSPGSAGRHLYRLGSHRLSCVGIRAQHDSSLYWPGARRSCYK